VVAILAASVVSVVFIALEVYRTHCTIKLLFFNNNSNNSWELRRKIASISGDNREPSFFFQCILITVQRFNSILLHNSFSSDEE